MQPVSSLSKLVLANERFSSSPTRNRFCTGPNARQWKKVLCLAAGLAAALAPSSGGGGKTKGARMCWWWWWQTGSLALLVPPGPLTTAARPSRRDSAAAPRRLGGFAPTCARPLVTAAQTPSKCACDGFCGVCEQIKIIERLTDKLANGLSCHSSASAWSAGL